MSLQDEHRIPDELLPEGVGPAWWDPGVTRAHAEACCRHPFDHGMNVKAWVVLHLLNLAADLAREREERSLDQAEKEATLELARHWKEQADKCDTTALSLRCKELRQGLDAERERAEQADRLCELVLDRFDLALDEFDPTGDLRAEYQVLNDRDRAALGQAKAGKDEG